MVMMMMRRIIHVLVLLGVLFNLPSVTGQIQEEEKKEKDDDVWEFLGKVGEKDRFSYDICDGRFLDSVTGDYGRCYSIQMSVENIIYIKNNTFYYTHAVTHHHGEDGSSINVWQDRLFLIDANHYKVRPIFPVDKDYATSLQNTIFWRGGWGNTVDTQYGAESAVNVQVNDPDTAMVISDVSVAHNGAMQYTASYDRFEKSFFVINNDIPLPVSASISKYVTRPSDSTQELFSFKLKNFETVRYTPVPSTVTYSMTSQGGSIQDDTVMTVIEDQVSYPEIINGHFEVQWR